MNHNCPLCSSRDTYLYSEINKSYYRCSSCGLIFVDSQNLPSFDSEKSRYESHENGVLSDGYKRFLYNIINPLKSFVRDEMLGLDYGSGPYPMLQDLLFEEGIAVDSYDPFFKPNFPNKKYDYIILCEVIEHFHKPEEDFKKITSLLKNNAMIFIQTSLTDNVTNFNNWYYKNDLTHTSFYSKQSLLNFKKLFNIELIDISASVIRMKYLGANT